MSLPKIFDCTQVKVIAWGIPISKGPGASGYAEGAFLEIEQDGPSWKVKKGADGSITRSATNEPGTKISVHLMSSSSSNAVFSKMWNLDVNGINGAGIGTFVGSDMQGTSVFEAEAFWVVGPPKKTYSQEGETTTWECYGCEVERLDGGN
jgi:hypothetical protein